MILIIVLDISKLSMAFSFDVTHIRRTGKTLFFMYICSSGINIMHMHNTTVSMATFTAVGKFVKTERTEVYP